MTNYQTHKDKFLQDPRIQEAKKLILSALTDAQRTLTDVQEKNPNLKEYYNEYVEKFREVRGGGLFYPYIGTGFGHGPLVELLDGSVKYDLISGIGTHYFGHSHPDIVLEAFDASLSNTIMQGNLQQNIDSFELMNLLTSLSALDHCFLSTSGAMACENALKIAFQHTGRSRIIAFDNCFCGRTIALSQITDRPKFREGIPLNTPVDYIPFFDPEKPQESTERTLLELKKCIARYPDQHAVISMELVQGDGGINVGTQEYFKQVIELCRQHGIIVWIDEVQTFARTHELFAFQYFNLQKLVDIVTIGKASLVCATLFHREIAPKRGLLSQTFTSSTAAIRASKFVIEQAIKTNFFGQEGKIAKFYERFTKELALLETRYGLEVVKGPWGIGAMIGCTVFGGDGHKTHDFLVRLFDNGVIAFMAGEKPARVRFLPPVGALDEGHIPKIFQIIDRTIKEFL